MVAPPAVRLLVGGYSPPRGHASGITLVDHYRADGRMEVLCTAAQVTSPSALAASIDGRTIFAVEEADPGFVHSFQWAGHARLKHLSTQPSGGADPCHMELHPSGRYLLTANYSGATIAAHAIGADATLAPATDVYELPGSGLNQSRQLPAHPHQIALREGGDELAVPDLGADRIVRVGFAADTGQFGPVHTSLEMPPGSGPRQIVFSADGRVAYVLGEIDSTLAISEWPPGRAPSVHTHCPGSVHGVPAGNLAAALVLSEDGHTLFTSHRGADVVSVFDVGDGVLIPRRDLPAGGRGPRHLAIVDHWLYVANELSGTVAALDLLGHDAMLTAPVPSATFVLPVRY